MNRYERPFDYLDRAYVIAQDRVLEHPLFGQYLEDVIKEVARVATDKNGRLLSVQEIRSLGGLTAITKRACADVQQSDDSYGYETVAGFGRWAFDFKHVAFTSRRQEIRNKAVRRIERGNA